MAERCERPLDVDLYAGSYAAVLVPLCRGRVLDIGCGEGWVTEAIAKQPAVESVLATDKFEGEQRRHDKIIYLPVLTEALIALDNNSNPQLFDTIISTEHIEHLEAPIHKPLLAWIKTHLAPGGQFLGSMPDSEVCAGPWHKKEYRVHNWYPVISEFFPQVKLWNVQSTVYVWSASLGE
jgi:2-polyprenyl-3-methyl-5-hydroxy-6-metoxy-1,4-benzoquinol methylase